MLANLKQFNYQSSCIPVPSGLNISNWRRYLVNYDLSILCEYLQYGFPLNVDYENFQPITKVTNHASALKNPEAVDKYFADEISYKAIVGPLPESPFKVTHYSPLLTRAKSDGGTRVIVDLSWPLGAGVNQFVPDDVFDFMEFQLKYPTIDHIVHKISEVGPDALLYKVDLQRAFRNLRIDPLDYKVLGLMWRNQTFIDVSLAFGFKQGASACQLTTDAVTYLMWTQRHWVANYLDDIIGVSPPSEAKDAFLTLTNLLQALGLPISYKKVEEPHYEITSLGININARSGVLTIPDSKICKIKSLIKHWLHKETATKHQLQKLVGNLLHIHRCVKPARLFTNRILQTLRGAPAKGSIRLSKAFFKDTNWFAHFLEVFNGSVEIHSTFTPTSEIYVDSCLTGMGALSR